MPQGYYTKRTEILEAEISVVQKKLNQTMINRIITFVGLIAIMAVSIYLRQAELLFSLFIPLVIFGYLIKKNSREKQHLGILTHQLLVNHQELDCLSGKIKAFENGEEFKNSQHSFSHDLDVFGENSLFQLLNRTTSYESKSKFAERISDFETDSGVINNNQEAVKELTEKSLWREEFRANGLFFSSNEKALRDLFEWKPEEISLFKNKRLGKVILWAVPFLISACLVATCASILPFSFFSLLLILPLGIVGKRLKAINLQHKKISKFVELLLQFNKLSLFIEKEDFASKELKSIKHQLLKEEKIASAEIYKLARIAQQLDNRSNPLFAILMDALFLWDLQYISQLKSWLETNSKEIEPWFDAVYKIEYYSSLAFFSFNNPNYTFPLLNEKPVLNTTNLGHPLIRNDKRINNDFTINNLQEFVIITGANMAGKSTFLRAIGCNLILAMLGAPACAKEFKFKPTPLFSSMRTSDSLSDSESYFYSELKRLQTIVNKLKSGEQLFVILDEILKGTNSKDKAEGSKKFVKQLINYQTAGIIATHDLSLCEVKNEFPEQLNNYYFDVEIENDELIFDYKLKSGICSNMNAEFLMKKMGITE